MDIPHYVFRFDAYTPQSIPMARLGAYLLELASLMGSEAHVHFDKLSKGSTKVHYRVEQEDVPKVERRLHLVGGIDAPEDVQRSVRRINALLVEDGARGTLRRVGSGKVIKFPGKDLHVPQKVGPVREFGEIEGELVKVGGKDDTSHMLLIGDGGREYKLVTRSRDTAKAMAAHLYETLRVHGVGAWIRDDEGWQLQQLTVETFEPIEQRSVVEVVAEMRAIGGGEWGGLEDPLGECQKMRRG